MLIIITVLMISIERDTAGNIVPGDNTSQENINTETASQYELMSSNSNDIQSQVIINPGIKTKAKKDLYFLLILDDAGFSKNYEFLDYDRSLNISVIPDTYFAKEWIKKINKQNNHELMMHIPMSAYSIGLKGIYDGISLEKISFLLDKWMLYFAGVKGANNHQGSYATANRTLMKRFFSVFKKYGLYFVDSITIGNTKAYTESKRAGIFALQRHIFLDHIRSESFIRQQLNSCIRVAKQIGFVVAIGHVTTPNLLNILKSYDNEFKRCNIKFLKISDFFALNFLSVSYGGMNENSWHRNLM